MTQSLGEELASDGIFVNAIVPSVMDTPANRRGMPDADHSQWPSVAAVASTIAFLLSPSNTATLAVASYRFTGVPKEKAAAVLTAAASLFPGFTLVSAIVRDAFYACLGSPFGYLAARSYCRA